VAKTYRTLQLKVVEYVEEDDPSIIPIDELIQAIQKKSPSSWSERHVPAIDEIEDGRQCSFIDEIAKPPAKCPGVTFRFASYIKGEKPPGLKNDFKGATADIAESILKDIKTDERREPAVAFHALAFGSAVIIEFVKGSGGMALLEKCLTALARRHVYSKYPTIHLKDVASRELSAAIDRAGGVQEVILDIMSHRRNITHEFGAMLRDARSKIGGTAQLRLEYKADKESALTKADVMKAHNEYSDREALGIDNLVIVLKGGEKFIGDDKCKVCKRAEFEHDPTPVAVVREMAEYLLELQEVEGGVAVLTPDGRIPTP
jgi:hypothetical protein